MTVPTVSIVMSVYNGAQNLPETIESVLVQEYSDFEFIIVNDGSTDSAPKVLEKYASLDGRIKLIHQENHGLTVALVKACSIARGQFIARQDTGDLSDKNRLNLQLEAMLSYPSLSFVSSWTNHIGPLGEQLYIKKGTGTAKTPIDIVDMSKPWGIVDGPTHHGSVLFRVSSYNRVGGYRKEYYYGQDWDLWLRLAAVGKFMLIPRVLYTARITPDSISATYKDYQRKTGKLNFEAFKRRVCGGTDAEIVKKISKLRPTEKTSEKNKSKADGYYFIAEALRRNGNPKCESYFSNALQENWIHYKSWIRLLTIKLDKLGILKRD